MIRPISFLRLQAIRAGRFIDAPVVILTGGVLKRRR
jgi:hypothetical protein